MKILVLLIISMNILSCSNKVCGIYNTNHSKDRSVFYQIKLSTDYTVEKTEIHTISDFAKGTYQVTNDKQIVCFLDSSISKFPPDTLTFKLKGEKLYFVKKGALNKAAYLTKQKK